MLKVIESEVKKHLVQEGLKLSSATTGYPQLQSLLTPFCPGGELHLHDVKLDTDDKVFRIKARGDFWRILDGEIEVLFSQTNSEVEVMIRSIASNWRMADTFQNIAGSNEITGLRFAEARFGLSNASDMPAGLSFEGNVELDGELDFFKEMIHAKRLHLEGLIEVDGDQSNLRLRGPLVDSYVLGPLELRSPQLLITARFDGKTIDRASVGLESIMKLGDGPGIALTGVMSNLDCPQMTLFASSSGIALSSLKQLTPLLGKLLPEMLPENLTKAAIEINRFEADLNLAAKKIRRLSLDLKSKGKWEAWPGLFELDDLFVELRLSHPADAHLRDFSAKLHALTTIFNTQAEASVSLPGPLISASTEADAAISFGEIARQYLPGELNSLIPAGLAVSQMDLTFNGYDKTLLFACQVQGHWTFKIDESSIIIKELEIDLRVALESPTDATLTIKGHTEIANRTVRIDSLLSLKGAIFQLSFPTLPLKAILARYFDSNSLGPELTDLTIEGAAMMVHADQGEFELRGRLVKKLEFAIGKGRFTVDGLDIALARTTSGTVGKISTGGQFAGTKYSLSAAVADSSFFEGHLSKIGLAGLVAEIHPDLPIPVPEITIDESNIRLTQAGDFNLKTAVAIDFSTLIQRAGIPLPDGFGPIDIDILEIDKDASSGDWYILLASNNSSALNTSVAGIMIEKPQIKFRSQNGQESLQIKFGLSGQAKLAEDIVIRCRDLILSLTLGENKWRADGDIELDLFNVTYLLEAEIDIQEHGSAYRFRYPQRLELIQDLMGCSVDIADLTLEAIFLRDKAGKNKAGAWQIKGQSKLAIQNVLEAKGELGFESDHKGHNRFTISYASPQISKIPLMPDLAAAFGKTPELLLDFDVLKFMIGASENKKSNWTITATARLQFFNIPDLLAGYLPAEELSGRLDVDDKKLAVIFDVPSTLQPRFPELAFSFANDKRLSLGQPAIKIGAIALEFGEKFSVAEILQVKIPKELNYLCGRDERDRPNLDLFRGTFDLKLVFDKRLRLQLLTSPFKDLEFYEKNDKLWSKWNLGDFGVFGFQTPEFAFDGQTWAASVGVERQTDLQLPLRPLKFVLQASGFPKTINKVLPDALPIKEIDLARGDIFNQLFGGLGPTVMENLPGPVKIILDELAEVLEGVVDRLPRRLQEYAKLSVPEEATLDMTVDTKGGTHILLRMEGVPLKFMLPSLMPPVPALLGISVREFGFGQCMGGSMAMIRFDGHIDSFNLIELVTAITAADLLGDNRHFHCRYVLEKSLLMMPTGLPVIVPLFYKQLGLEYQNVFGLGLDSHWQFPEPELDPFAILAIVMAMYLFLTRKDYLLHREGLSDQLPLNFSIGTNFIKLPGYLGGKTLGLTKQLPPFDVTGSIARILDSIKTTNPRYAIEAIPLKIEEGGITHWIRLGEIDVRFGPIGLQAGWCIVTEKEFEEDVITRAVNEGKLSAKTLDGVLNALPERKDGQTLDNGFMVLLMGGWDIVNIVGMTAQFGISLTREEGLQTGFRLTGRIADFLELSLTGTIQAEPNSVAINGRTLLTAGEHTLIDIKGVIAVSSERFLIAIEMQLTPFFKVQGDLFIGKGRLAIHGEVYWQIGKNRRVGGGTDVVFSNKGASFGLDVDLYAFRTNIRVDLPGIEKDSLFTARVAIQFDEGLQQAFKEGIEALLSQPAVNSANEVYGDIQASIHQRDEYKISINGLSTWLPGQCKSIERTITKTINKHTQKWYLRAGRKTAHKKARPSINRLRRLAAAASKTQASDAVYRRDLKKAINDIINHNSLKIKVIGITAYSKRNLMGSTNIKKLRKAVANIDNLQRESDIVIKKQAVLDNMPPRDRVLAEVKRGVAAGVENAVPTVRSVYFKTRLGSLDTSRVTVAVEYAFAGKVTRQSLTLDLSSPKEAVKQVVAAFT